MNTLGNLCGYIYLKSNKSYIYYCIFCKCSFQSLNEYQIHNEKEHYFIYDRKEDQSEEGSLYEEKNVEAIHLNDLDYLNLYAENSIDEKLNNHELKFNKEAHPYYDVENVSSGQICDVCEAMCPKNEFENHLKEHGLYKCSKCTKVYRNSSQLKIHSKTHVQILNSSVRKTIDISRFEDNDKDLSRAISYANFESRTSKLSEEENSISSMMEEHDKNLFTTMCYICEVACPTGEFEEHLNTHGLLKCNFCPKIFQSFSDKKRHLSTHSKYRRYKCEICAKSFNKILNLKSHISCQHKDFIKTKECIYCCLNFLSLKDKLIHLKECKKRFHFCMKCDEKFDSLTNLTEHMNTHGDSEPIVSSTTIKCYICEESCVKDKLNEHFEAWHGRFKCQFCRKRFKSKSIWERHTRTHTGEKPFRCQTCFREFAFVTSFKRHLALHFDGIDYECNYCDQTFKAKELVDLHIQLKHLKGNQNRSEKIRKQCEYCGVRFIKTSSFSRHQLNRQIKYSCQICKKKFCNSKSWVEHTKSHIGTESDKNVWKICHICNKCMLSKKFEKHLNAHEKLKCKYCSKYLKKPEILASHLRTHTGEKPFKCDVCSVGFAERSNLRVHKITQHTDGEKTVECKICGKKFITVQLMNWHARVHYKGKHQCKFCDASYRTPSLLRNHEFSNHTDYDKRPYHCTFCDKKFISSNNLSDHMNTHTGEKPHKCLVCQRNFTAKKSLSKHKRIKGH